MDLDKANKTIIARIVERGNQRH
ncbi:hypothetical protein [Chryseobacterium gleum]